MSFQRKAAREMELFRTDQYYIFISGEYSLWWNRQSGEFLAKSAWDLASADDPECLGIFYGIIGKIELQSVVESRLMLIKETGTVGDLPGGKTVYKIKSVVFLPLGQAGDTLDLGLKPCRKHQDNRKTSITAGGIFDLHQKAAFAKTWGTIKSATNTIKNTTQQAAAIATAQVKLGKRRDSKDREKFERRILEELQRIFTETDSFYYSWDGDLTNALQRQYDLKAENNASLWKRVDDRYFWNKHMLQDIVALNGPLADPWILPIIQGFVQIENCKVEIGFDPAHNEALEPKYEVFTLVLISRRSRYRAGTRYKRRGVDENGKCANYVETEQIVSYHHHQVSFVQVRGSVPVFWSQPGYKYRPPPRIDKGEVETQAAFEKHFEEEMELYGPVCVINLVDQTGKERIIWDAYTNHMLMYNHHNITYCTFDFHEYCRGMHFENVSVLIASLADVIREMNYCWTDKEGRICSQKGVFRVNCIDCLDRTNVVQTAIAKAVMEIQFSKLGLISPEGSIPSNVRNKFQLLWANNGDIISKQYAGTNALKGDYTRTGERKLSGMMKDGMNSANRYYLGHFVDSYRQAGMDLMQGQEVDEEDLECCSNELQTAANIAQALVPISPPMYTNDIALGLEMKFLSAVYHMSRYKWDTRGEATIKSLKSRSPYAGFEMPPEINKRYYLSRFKDAYRQATIDMMLGNPVSEDVFSQEKTADEEDAAATAEHVKLVIEDCKKMLISNTEVILGAWGLIDADPVSGDPTETEMDTILILTRDSYYVAEYDDHVDRVTKYQRVLLDDIMQLEFGIPESTMSLFKQSNKNQIGRHCIRINYRVVGVEGYFHTFRSTNLRFFNNMAIGIKTDEEMIESLKAIIEAFIVAMEIAGIPAVPFRQGRLEKRKSKVLASGGSNLLGGSCYLDVCSIPHMTRNVSETQLLSLKTVGSKALSNVTQQFSKLNKLSHSFNAKKSKPSFSSTSRDPEALFVVGAPEAGSAHSISKPSSDEEEEMHVAYNFDQSQRSSLAHNVAQCEVKPTDLVLPSVGILMSTKVSHPRQVDDGNLCTIAPLIDNVCLSRVVQNVSIRGHVLTHSRTDLSLDVSSLAPLLTSQNSSLTPSPMRAGSTTPEITVENTSQPQQPAKHKQKLTPPNTLQLVRKFSHSSDEVDKRQGTSSSTKHRTEEQSKQPSSNNPVKFDEGQRSSSVRDLSLNITSSQSENALRSFRSGITNVITSPAAATKDLVLSPLSKFARGMQNLGANLDPRKLKPGSGIGRHVVTEQQLEEHRRLQERWRNCRTRLIAL